MARFDTRKPERVSLSLGGRRINININNLIGEAKWAIDMILTNHFANSMFSSCYFCFLFVLFSFFERGRSNRRLQRQRVKNTSSWIWYRGHWFLPCRSVVDFSGECRRGCRGEDTGDDDACLHKAREWIARTHNGQDKPKYAISQPKNSRRRLAVSIRLFQQPTIFLFFIWRRTNEDGNLSRTHFRDARWRWCWWCWCWCWLTTEFSLPKFQTKLKKKRTETDKPRSNFQMAPKRNVKCQNGPIIPKRTNNNNNKN